MFGSVILNCNKKGNVRFVRCGTKNTNDVKITSDEVDLNLPCGVCVCVCVCVYGTAGWEILLGEVVCRSRGIVAKSNVLVSVTFGN